jgi:hypothetical protein
MAAGGSVERAKADGARAFIAGLPGDVVVMPEMLS